MDTTALLFNTRGDIEMEEENYIEEPDYEKEYEEYYQKCKDRARERIREKDRKEDIDKYDKSPIRKDDLDLESDLDSDEEAERQKLQNMTAEQSHFAKQNKY